MRRSAGIWGSILILFDQFEEYFLYHPESQRGNTFDSEFACAVNREDVDAGFLIAVREDALSRLDRFRARILSLLGNTLRLQHLSAVDAEAAIRKPLDVFNARASEGASHVLIEDELVRSVLLQVRTGQVSLGQSAGVGQAQTGEETTLEAPFLQLVMTRLPAVGGGEEERFPHAACRHLAAAGRRAADRREPPGQASWRNSTPSSRRSARASSTDS